MTDATRVRPLQLRLCEMLVELDWVCRTQGLTYYLVAGTMLGAVRHQGFIPWDDDLDVGMPRADYDRLFAIAATCLPPHLELKNFTSHPNFPWWFMKLEDSRTTLIEKTHFNYTGGVYIDIFPLDGEPADRHERRRHIKRIVRLQKICYYLHRDPYKRGQGVSSWPTRVCRRLYDRQQLHHRLDTELRRYDYDRSDWVCDHDHGEVSLMPKAYMGTPTPVLFEGLSFMGVAQPDAYLKSMYGDYMTLPPAGRRQQHDFHHVDLETPYRSHPSMVAS